MSMKTPSTVLAAPDKFRGSLTGPEVAEAIAAGAQEAHWSTVLMPLADGGEGLVEALGGATHTSEVTGPKGAMITADWRLGDDGVAVIESAAASGLALAGGASGNDPLAATSTGTGELIVDAVRGGARKIIVGLGGSAMTDGGFGAVTAVLEGLGQTPREAGVEVIAACDVSTAFTDAAAIFGPQKGASAQDVVTLTTRLTELQDHYAREYGVRLTDAPGAGAAGGLGGGLLALGATLQPGFALVAEHLNLAAAIEGADLVVTGEGALDLESFNGKVVGEVIALARAASKPVLVIAGIIKDHPTAAQQDGVTCVDLTARFGPATSWHRTAEAVGQVVTGHLSELAT